MRTYVPQSCMEQEPMKGGAGIEKQGQGDGRLHPMWSRPAQRWAVSHTCRPAQKVDYHQRDWHAISSQHCSSVSKVLTCGGMSLHEHVHGLDELYDNDMAPHGRCLDFMLTYMCCQRSRGTRCIP